jgi:Spy/CpxP family protein refolding chaperone
MRRPGGRQRGLQVLGRFLRGLDLSEEQREKVKGIIQGHRKKALEMMGKGVQDARVAHQRLRKELLDQMRGVLDEEQVQKLERALDRLGRGQGPGGGPGGPPGPGPRRRPPGGRF